MRVAVVFLVVLGICCGQETTTPAAETTTYTTTPTTTAEPTTTPEPTTTTIAPSPNTTVVPDNTTTVAPTTAAPTTVAPVPHSDFYMVTEDNVTCIMFSGDFRLSVTYTDNEEKSKRVEVRVPGPGANTTATGSCSIANTTDQSLSVHFGNVGSSSFNLVFNADAKQYELVDVSLSLPLDEATFPGAKDTGKTLSVSGTLPGLSNTPVMLNNSLSCRSSIDSSNFTAVIHASNETYTATATGLGFKFQAFNTVPDVAKLNDAVSCSNDTASDLVPIAVGCALAALVVLVLISYLIGRRRRASAYESV